MTSSSSTSFSSPWVCSGFSRSAKVSLLPSNRAGTQRLKMLQTFHISSAGIYLLFDAPTTRTGRMGGLGRAFLKMGSHGPPRHPMKYAPANDLKSSLNCFPFLSFYQLSLFLFPAISVFFVHSFLAVTPSLGNSLTARELGHLLIQPHMRALLSAHDLVATKV
jgi:hypothetical protein